MIRVLLTDDHALVRAGIHSLLQGMRDVKVVGEASSGEEAIELAERERPDVVLMDIAMKGITGLEAAAQMRERYPEVRVVILSMHSGEEYVLQALRAGASGYILKGASTSELELAIRTVAGGETFLGPSISGTVISNYLELATRGKHSSDALTSRQREVLQLLAEGNSTKQIAFVLYDGFTALDLVGAYEVIASWPDAEKRFLATEGYRKKAHPSGKAIIVNEQTIRCGSKEFVFSLPRGRLVRRLEPEFPPATSSAGEILAGALKQPLGSPPLAEIARGKKSAAILIPGKARLAGTREYMPALVGELNKAGLPDDSITVFLADGTHEQHLESDVAALLGENLVSRIRCLGHDCRKEEEVLELGTTSFGTPVLINRRVLDSEVKVLTGRIVPHYFAGFSGGRKALIPGVAGFRTILANHRLTLDRHRGIHPAVGLCSLADNPVHLDMLEGARMAKPDFCLNTLLNSDHQMIGAVAGDFEAAHEEGCRLAAQWLRLTLAEPVDVLITSAGGLPYDCNFMQALKAVFNVQDIVRPGGAILWVAECPQGINPGFLGWAAIRSDTELDEAVRAKYSLTGHNSIMLRQLIRKADVALCSTLPREVVAKLGLHPVSSLEEGVRWVLEKFAGAFTYAVVPYANAMCAQRAE
jgi:nickel-dependent lactate racemase/DNA-binding NarL/FixJ family response regulator